MHKALTKPALLKDQQQLLNMARSDIDFQNFLKKNLVQALKHMENSLQTKNIPYYIQSSDIFSDNPTITFYDDKEHIFYWSSLYDIWLYNVLSVDKSESKRKQDEDIKNQRRFSKRVRNNQGRSQI